MIKLMINTYCRSGKLWKKYLQSKSSKIAQYVCTPLQLYLNLNLKAYFVSWPYILYVKSSSSVK